MKEAIEMYRLAAEFGRSGGTARSADLQYVTWREGQFDCRILPHNSEENVPRQNHEYTFIYLMTAGDTVKVGMSRNPETRVKALRAGASRRIECRKQFKLPKPGARYKEAQCHRLLRDFRTSGEWFKVREIIAEAVIQHVITGTPDQSGIQAILDYETYSLSRDGDRDERFRREMAIRANPTICTRTAHFIHPVRWTDLPA